MRNVSLYAMHLLLTGFDGQYVLRATHGYVLGDTFGGMRSFSQQSRLGPTLCSPLLVLFVLCTAMMHSSCWLTAKRARQQSDVSSHHSAREGSAYWCKVSHSQP